LREGALVDWVLVVGVDGSLSHALAALLRGEGCRRTEGVATAEAALPLLSQDAPSLLVSDALLPGLPGIALALRALERDIPVLMLSDEPAMTSELEALGLPVLPRSIAAADLLAQGRQLVERAAKQRALGRPALRHMRPDLVSSPLNADAGNVTPLRRGRGRAQDFIAGTPLADALAYWQGKCAGRMMPQRRDIDPSELRSLLPHIQLIEPIAAEGRLRFRYRLVGTAIVEAYGGELTGRYVDELISGERARFVHDYYGKVCEGRRPVFVRSRYLTRKSVDLTANRLLMPLSADGERVSLIFAALTFEFTRAMSGGDGIGKDAELDLTASQVEVLG
jgi:CheY-like chemotaxis protein